MLYCHQMKFVGHRIALAAADAALACGGKGGEVAGVVRIDIETNCCHAADVPLQLKGEI